MNDTNKEEKSQHAGSSETGMSKKSNKCTSRRRTSLIGMTVLALGIASLMVGIHRREHVMVAQKSNMICLECIGIG